MQEAFFDKIRSKIIPLLRKASNEVSIAMAWFTSAELFSELINCLKRGVTVELVLLDNPINFMEYAPDFNEFIKAGGSLHIASLELGLMHHKFCVIDTEIVITGSYNWTYYAETRNIENILITDDKKVVGLFVQEFNRLIEEVQCVGKAPRYTWDVLESMDNLNFADINYEAEQISHYFNKPNRKVIETKTQVYVSEIEQNPISAYGIGIYKKNDDEREDIELIIPKGVKLPYISREHTLHFNSKEHDILVSHIIGQESCNSGILIWEGVFNEITCGIILEDLSLNYSMTLDINGDLKMIVNCIETGKRKTITVLNQKLVKYV